MTYTPRGDLDVPTLVEAYEGGESAASLSRRYKASVWTILSRLRNAGVRIRTRVEQNERRLNLPEDKVPEFRALVDGILLGDGWIDRKGLLRLEQAEVRLGWIKDVEARLEALGGSSRVIKIPPRTRVLDGREIRSKGGHLLYTPAYVELQAERRRWYPDGIKIVPQDVDLSPLSLAYWLCGDGTNGGDGALTFCTNGFTRAEVDLLAARLTSIGINAYGASSSERPGEWCVKVVQRDSTYCLKKMVEDLVPECCQYKLDFIRPKFSGEELAARQKRRLTDHEIIQIQLARSRGDSVFALARRYDVSAPTIYNALKKDIQS